MSQRTNVLEYSRPVVDGDTILGVKVIGTKSRNGYGYPVEVLRKAKPLYEGAAVFILHPTSRERKGNHRKLRDHFGSLHNVRERGDADSFGVFADLTIKPSHPMATDVLEHLADAHFGLSHNAVVVMNDDGSDVTEILEINSVDLVDDPATTQNLFESEDEMSTEFQDKLMTRLDALEKKIDAKEAQAVVEEKKPPEKKTRLSALEARGEDGGGDAKPIGNSHEDLLAVLNGYSTS